MKKWKKTYSLFEDLLSGFFLLSGLALIFYEVIMRYIFNSPSTWITEVSTVMVTWGILFGLSVALRDKHHISVDILYSVLPQFLQRKVDYFANLVGIVFCGFYAWSGIALVIHTLETGQTSMDTGIPLWMYYLAVPISGVLFLVRFVENFIVVRKSRKKTDAVIQMKIDEEESDEYSNAF
ncbi:TRAP transporter small permease [Bacillus massiliglaciei]|uniref:TRAP transporter small permease n=1 Tax=Bacillus massiliglaciei TaxID=1816693 RepID=UPI000DA63B9B|nr:TRAP transporter small permease [Bacillus massiliglaciei]